VLELALMLQYPMLAVSLSDYIGLMQALAGALACILVGYLSDRLPTRMILAVAMLLSVVSGITYVFKNSVAMVFVSVAVGGIGYGASLLAIAAFDADGPPGMALTSAIAYYARCTAPQNLMAPMTLVFLCVDLLCVLPRM
jgi:MFS family permease